MKANERIPIAVLAEPNPSLKKRVANWIRLNCFVPDAKLGWWPGAVREGSRAIREERPDVIFSSAPPATTHLVAKALANRFRLPWVADFRDPWTDTHYYEGHTRAYITRRIDESLERSVCVGADRLVFVSRLDLDAYADRHGGGQKSVHIANGYDELDFSKLPAVEPLRDKFTLVHLGGIGIERNPEALFRAARSLMDAKEIDPAQFRIQLIGNVQESVVAACQRANAESFVEIVPYVPHEEALSYAARAHALLLLITQSHHNLRILPGKTFEYIRYGKPIITLGPPGGEVDRILREVKAGEVLSYDDAAGITEALRSAYSRWRQGGLASASNAEYIASYTRENLTKQLASVFDELTGFEAKLA
jgi:glycosyltransferase involved in cell wall biosynthesis